MKKTLLLFTLTMFFINSSFAADFVIDNFDSKAIGTTYQLKAWYPTDGTATVVADPANASNRVVNIVTTNWDAMLQLTVTLPAGQTLGDYTGFSFDIYIPTNANDANPNYKNGFVFIDDVKKFEDSNYPMQAPMTTWTTKSFTLASLNLTAAERAKTTFTIAFGMSTDKGNYFVDNVKLTGGPGGGNGGNGGGGAVSFVINDFNASTVGQTFGMKAWYPTDGSATVAVDPANSSNKAVNIVTSNWDALLKLDVALPAGNTLANYETFSFDIYIPTNAGDANPNYKNMNIYIDDVKKYEDTSYPLQADIAVWTTKTYQLSALNLTAAELAKSSFSIAFGMSTNAGNYFIDNVKMTAKTGPLNTINPEAQRNNVFISGNTLHFADMMVDKVVVYDLKGSVRASGQNISTLDVSGLSSGLYIIRTEKDAQIFVNKIIKQ